MDNPFLDIVVFIALIAIVAVVYQVRKGVK